MNDEFNTFKRTTLTKDLDDEFAKLSSDQKAKIKKRLDRGGDEYARCRRQQGIPDSESY